MIHPRTRHRSIGVSSFICVALFVAACGSDKSSSSSVPQTTTAPTEAAAATTAPVATTADTQPAPADSAAPADDGLPAFGTPERCAANKAAGKLIFLTGYDYAADAGILDIVAAKQQGFFDDMCLNVELQGGVAPQNSAALASGTTQLGVAATFGEMVSQNVNGGADLVGFAQLGHTSISELLVPADSDVKKLSDLKGKTVGIKGDIPFAVQAMMEKEGLKRGTYTELLLDGYDPVAQFKLGIDALPVYKSNEPATLDEAGFKYRSFDPLDYDIPSSFAVYETTRTFYEANPTAVEDFVRAGLKGYYFAAENPEKAVDDAFALIEAAGNQFYLAKPHELFRWGVEQKIVEDVTPKGMDIGELDAERLGEEAQQLTDLGVFPKLPDWKSMIETGIVPKLYDNGTLIWAEMDS